MTRITLAAVLLLAGCSDYYQGGSSAGLDPARSAVLKALASEYDNVPKDRLEPYTECIVSNATRLELAGLATGSVGGPTPQVVEAIDKIIARAPTARCISAVAIQPLAVG